MRIGHILPSLSPLSGGGFSAAYQLVRSQARMGHKIFIFTFQRKKQAEEGILSEGDGKGFKTRYHYLDNVNILPLKFLPFFGSKISIPMMKNIFRSGLDILHLHGMANREQKLIQGLIGGIRHMPVVWTVHGLHEHYMIAQNSLIAYPFLIFPLTLTMNLCDGIIALSPFDKKVLYQIGASEDKISIIPNGVDWDFFKKKPSTNRKRSLKQKYELNSDIIILSVGAIRPNKGFENIIKVANSFEYDFVIAGSIDDNNYFRKLKILQGKSDAENLKFLGWVSDADLRDLFFLSDIFLLPSLSETLPLVILEAMASENPVVSTSVGGIPHLIEDGKNGFLVPPNDKDSIKLALRKLIRDSELRREMGIQNRRMIKFNFTWEKVARKTLELYSELI